MPDDVQKTSHWSVGHAFTRCHVSLPTLVCMHLQYTAVLPLRTLLAHEVMHSLGVMLPYLL